MIAVDLLPTIAVEATALCRAVAGVDLQGKGCYVVPFSLIEADVPALSGGLCGGWTNGWLDMELRDLLVRRGEWVGRGFATVVRDEYTRTRSEVLDIALHELAHYLDSSPPIVSLPESEVPSLLLSTAAELSQPRDGEAVSEKRQAINAGELPRWHDHDLPFIRAAVHIRHRAQRAGYFTTLSSMRIAGDFYGLSSAIKYERAVGLEVCEREHESIRSIVASEPPRALLQLWESDTQ